MQTPVLIDADYHGRSRNLIVSASRNGFLYILDRTNGKFPFGIGRYKGWGGIMTTAGGLLAHGDDVENFVILDARTGKSLWHFKVGQLIHASPMSYAVDGKRYFSVAAGSDIFSFALP